MDLALTILDLELGGPAALAAMPTIPIPTLPGATTFYDIVASDAAGHHYAHFPRAKFTREVWTLDAPTMAEFDIPIDSPGLEFLPLPNAALTPSPEVQIYRNGHLIFWGPVVTRRCNSKERVWHYTAYDPLWYLMKRNMGEATRHNYLTNSSFDTDFAGWSVAGAVATSIDNSRFLIGGGSLHLLSFTSGENFRRQTFTIHSGSLGLALFLTAWVYVDSFSASAYSARGAFLGRVGASGSGAYGWSTLDVNTPLGTWVRMSTHVLMPPNVTETIDTRLYCPAGEVHWDGVTVTIMESLSFVNENSPGGTGWDQTLIAQMTVKYLGGALPIGDPYTKSNLRIATAGAASGIKKERTYQFFDHRPGYEGGVGNGALDEWTRANEGFDYRVDYDSDTVRTFRTYYPAVGQTWSEPFSYIKQQVDVDGNITLAGSYDCIVGYDFGETIEGSATDVCEMGGWGTDSGREEGAFFNDTALGNLTLELVEAAPADAPLDALDGIATQRGTQLGKPLATPILTMIEPRDPVTQVVTLPLIGVLLPGDLLPVTLYDGSVLMFDVVRATQVTLNEDETLSVAIAP